MASTTSRKIDVKFDGDAKGLIAAAAEGEAVVDRFGKSVDKNFRKSGDNSGKGFIKSMLRWFSPSALGEDLKKAGEEGGSIFSSGIQGVLKTPVVGPAIAAALVGAVAVAMPAVGAVAASGLVLAFGAGLAGLGIVFASKSEAVKAAWSKTLGDMGAQMKVLSKPFESTLISMAGVAKRTFATFKPALASAFKTMAPAVTQFGDQLGRALEKLAPAVKPLADAFGAVLKSLGPAMQSAVGNVADGLIKLSDSVKKSPSGIADLVKGIGDLLKATLDIITSLNDANGAFKDVTGGVSAVDVIMGSLTGSVKLLGLTVAVAVEPIKLLDKGLQKLGITHKDNAKSTDTATAATNAEADAQKKAASPAQVLADKFNRQKTATDLLVQSMFKLQNLALGLSGAEINFQQSIDDATSAVKNNGKNLDINTQKGRDNKSALDNIASSANAQTQALIDGGKGWVAADASAETSRKAFVKVAQQMGLSKSEAKKLADQLIAIPPKKNVSLAVTGAAKAKADVDRLANAVAALKNRTVYVNMVQSNIGGVPAGIKAPGRASGGPVVAGRTYLVGEKGPELVTMGGNGNVTPNHQLGGDTNIYVTIDGQQLQGRIDKTIRSNNRGLKRTVGAR